ncbi:MAG: anti-sigma factor antagonist [Lachnospiraceae bacterium]|nr:anti-sigma factor antagonist [Lachnospiraceae bacterium]
MEEMYAVKDNCLFVMMPKEMDHHKVDAIRMKIDEYLLDHRAQNVIFDFENTRFMDSSGIGLIVGRYKKVSCFGGKIVAMHVNARIQKILLMSGLKDMIEIV